ncbi:Terminal uridylyltransferase cid1 [Psilocybe cubensis]|uniref:polynucleotide adenylyltransferase n=2 Tax=Psilocybe cubensis TaxID=181762 RepID=A0A8H7XXZ5_PSICU|nr:Terminal uridylyltransferase cid1 [Psilocybe cubensis]KAH9476954.1 Terminal uridylyltransferase cid1 [Psilocybe cubensis]
MAYTQTLSPQPLHQQYHPPSTASTPPMQRRQATKQRFVAELSQCLFDFVIQLLPTQEEMAVKEDVRKLLERLIRTIEPDSRLLSFGSTANGFSLRNSDMDLCCLIDSEERLSATDLVTMLGDLLERETKFHVKPLPHARIPIVKLSLDPSPGLPLGIACDIGFENRLALENTRLLMCYAMIDPTRVRTMVLFLKVWSKRRKINSPYKGTLSSYGYVLLVIYFLVHVKNPPVLPNLQQMPPLRPISKEDTHLNGHNIWFFDDIDLLRQRWHSENVDTVAELLIDFFRYYSRDFTYNTGVASIRAGLLKKESKGWQNELSASRYNDARERNRLCIEDPFEIDYNVARCVTKDGLYTIRGEFMRAARILASRPDRAIVALAELCEERKDEELVVAPPYHSRPPTLPPQTPYTVGSQTFRTKVAERFSPPAQFFEPGPRQVVQPVTLRPPPEHMAPKRGKWTSPPPPDASSADHTLFENQLGMGLQLATSSTEAREKDDPYNSSESNSEVFTDEGSDIAEDDIKSVRSYTEGTTSYIPGSMRRPSWHTHDTARAAPPVDAFSSPGLSSRSSSINRGRFSRPVEKFDSSPPIASFSPDFSSSSSRTDLSRRSFSARPLKGPVLSSNTPLAIATPLPPSPASPVDSRFSDSSNVFYQTTNTRSPRPTALYPNHGTHSSLLSHYQTQTGYVNQVPHDIFPSHLPPSLSSSMNPRASNTPGAGNRSSGGPDTPTPMSYTTLHKHSLSSTTVTALTPPPSTSKFTVHSNSHSSQHANSPLTPSHDGKFTQQHAEASLASNENDSNSKHHAIPSPSPGNGRPQHEGGSLSPMPSAARTSTSTSTGSSPSPSSSTGYSTSISRSPSPHSPPPPPTAVPPTVRKGDDEEHRQSPTASSFATSFSALTLGGDVGNVALETGHLMVGLNPAEEKES